MCVHAVNIPHLKPDIRLFRDNSAGVVDLWGLPCTEVDNPSEFELEYLYWTM